MRKLLSLALGLLIPLYALPQEAAISGVVTDSLTQKPVPGVNVSVSTATGTSTNGNGGFSLDVAPGNYTVQFSFVGYKPKNITVSVEQGETGALTVKLAPKQEELNTVVITASKREQQIEEVPVSMEILPPRIIESKNTYNIETALEQVPSVTIMDGQANIRGGSGFSYGAGSRVLVLLDGMPLLSGDANDVKWNYLPVENVKQVEVLKGASSALFGSSALNGVINIRTKQPTEKPLTELSVFHGFYNDPVRPDSTGNRRDSAGNLRKPLKWWTGANPTYTGFNANHLRRIGKFEYGVQLNGFNDQGYRQGETEQRLRMNFQTGYQVNNKWKVELDGGGMYVNGGLFFLWDSDSTALQPRGGTDTATTTLSYYTNYRAHLDPKVSFYADNGDKHQLRTRYFLTDNRNITQPSAQANNFYGEYQYLHPFGAGRTITAGLAFSHTTVLSKLYGDHSSQNLAPYFQWDHRLGKLNWSVGVRGEYFRVDTAETRVDWLLPKGLTVTPDNTTWKDTVTLARQVPMKPVFRLGVNYQLFETTFLRASYGQGYRFPSIAERYVSTSISALNIFPNPGLQPETGWSGEIGVKQGVKLSGWKGFVDIAAFWTEYRNMTEFAFGLYLPDSVQTPSLGQLFQNLGFKSLNVGQARIRGIDFSISGTGNIGRLKTSLLLGYTFMQPISLNNDSAYRASFSDTSKNTILKYRFRHLAKADVMVEYKKWLLGFSARYNSFIENIDRSFEEPLFGTIEQTKVLYGLKEYRQRNRHGNLTLDARFGYSPTSNSTISLICNNLLNAENMGRPGDIQPARTLALRYHYKF